MGRGRVELEAVEEHGNGLAVAVEPGDHEVGHAARSPRHFRLLVDAPTPIAVAPGEPQLDRLPPVRQRGHGGPGRRCRDLGPRVEGEAEAAFELALFDGADVALGDREHALHLPVGEHHVEQLESEGAGGERNLARRQATEQAPVARHASGVAAGARGDGVPGALQDVVQTVGFGEAGEVAGATGYGVEGDEEPAPPAASGVRRVAEGDGQVFGFAAESLPQPEQERPFERHETLGVLHHRHRHEDADRFGAQLVDQDRLVPLLGSRTGADVARRPVGPGVAAHLGPGAVDHAAVAARREP